MQAVNELGDRLHEALFNSKNKEKEVTEIVSNSNLATRISISQYYDAVYVLRLIHFILYDWVFIIYNSIFVITFWKIGFKIAFCILYQIIENILFISVYILIYYEDDRCVHRTNEEFIFRKNGESKTYKILAFMVIDLLNYCLK